jgi:ribosomal-protein-alanine N-acetyltransferase
MNLSGASIRPCRPEEVAAVLELWRQAEATPGVTDNAEELRRIMAGSCADVLVAEADGRLVGSIIGTFDGWRGNIYRLAVHPNYRRQGVARTLVGEVEKRLATRGAKRITALVEKNHPWATGFWQAVGYGLDQRVVRHVRNLEVEAGATRAHATGCAVINLIVNDRIHLTEIRPSDKAACVKYLNDKEIHDLTLRLPHPYTEASFDEWFAIVQKMTKENGQPVQWAIRNEEDSWIGACGFRDFTIGKSHRAEIGYLLAKPYWGQGIMTAVVGRACNYAFGEWGLVRITAEVFAFNPASVRVLEKCGFVQEGYLRKQHSKNGRWIDAKLYALVK